MQPEIESLQWAIRAAIAELLSLMDEPACPNSQVAIDLFHSANESGLGFDLADYGPEIAELS